MPRLFTDLSVVADTWEMAEHAWLDYLTEHDEDVKKPAQLQSALQKARVRCERRVERLASERTAWLCFVRHWAAYPDKMAMLCPARGPAGAPRAQPLDRGCEWMSGTKSVPLTTYCVRDEQQISMSIGIGDDWAMARYLLY